MNKIELCAPEQCTGCGACKAVCPKNAIVFEQNDLGYVLPDILQDNCIHCGRCMHACPVLNLVEKRMPQKVYAAYYDDERRVLSASGGVSAALAESSLMKEKVVCGAVWRAGSFEEGNAEVRHELINSVPEISRIQGSKYVQSDTSDAYQKIEEILKQGKSVLYFGTPCQVAGLISAVSEKYREQLYTVDIICHGVCGKGLFRDYINCLRSKKNVVAFDFRDKTYGWGLNCKITEKSKKGNLVDCVMSCIFSSYYQIFLKGNMYRENCYSCQYACHERCSDLTIGDYWGVEEEHPEICTVYDVRKGISCILVNTEKGQQLLKETPSLKLFESSLEKVCKNNGQLNNPSKPGAMREIYTRLYRENGYEAVDKYFNRHEIPKKKKVRWQLSRIKRKLKQLTTNLK